MIPSLKKRFWSDVTTGPTQDGVGIWLDQRPLRTPAKAALLLPTPPLAEAVAEEWRQVETAVDPQAMPMTRRANAAIDKVARQQADVVAMLASYGETDLVCYRAASPRELADRQAAAWGPLIDWARHRFDAALVVTTGVVPVAQDGRALARLAAPLAGLGVFELTGFHDLVTLSGSLLIALAAIENHQSPESLFDASQVDEAWQAQLWGEDDEAQAKTAQKRQEFLDAFRFFSLARP